MKEKNKYETSDIYIASYLATCGLPFEFYREGKQVIFSFPDGEKAKELVLLYLNDKAVVPLKKYLDTFKNFKDLIFGNF